MCPSVGEWAQRPGGCSVFSVRNIGSVPGPTRTRVTALLTTPRSVSGFLDHAGERLSDAVNRPLESVLRLSNANLGRLGNLGANEPVSVAVIPKTHVALIYADQEAQATADRRVRSFVVKQTTELLVLIAGLRVCGTAHAASQLDPIQLHRLVLEGGADKFVVLTNARLSLDIEGSTDREIGLALVNARHIQFIAPLASAATSGPEWSETLARLR